MSGPRPRPRHVPPPPRTTMVWPRSGGSSSVLSDPADGPLLVGISVTVFPGRSSRPLSEGDAVLAGWATGSGAARTGAGAATATSFSLGSSGLERRADTSRAAHCEERRVRCWIRRCCISTGEVISTAAVWVTSVRSRCGKERAACSLASDPHPATTATKTVSGSRKMVRINPPGVERWLLRRRTWRRTSFTLPRLPLQSGTSPVMRSQANAQWRLFGGYFDSNDH